MTAIPTVFIDNAVPAYDLEPAQAFLSDKDGSGSKAKLAAYDQGIVKTEK